MDDLMNGQFSASETDSYQKHRAAGNDHIGAIQTVLAKRQAGYAYHKESFPFEEVARFDTRGDALAAGVAESHLWSVAEDGDGSDCWVFGPSHHHVNVIYFVQTEEAHDGNTYYEDWSQ